MAKEVSRKAFRAAKKARTVSISETKWNPDTAGKHGAAGRLTGPKGKRYTGTVDLGNGKTAVYRKGKRITKATTAGGGVTKAQAAAARKNAAAGSKSSTSKPSVSQSSKGRTGFSSSAANRGGYSAKGYQRRIGPRIAGSGSDAVNAATSSGSAKVSSVTDSLMSTPRTTKWGSEAPKQGTSNRPSQWRGQQTRLKKDKSGQLRWVKVGK